jgi:hypothetical protein
MQEPQPVEVRCEDCGVSFPAGTKRCIHCGERLGRGRRLPIQRGPAGMPPPVLDDVADEEVPTRSGVMSPVAILWLVLIIGGAIYRQCG